MAVSTDTIFKLTNAVERLATYDGSTLHRAQQALAALPSVNSAEFADDVAGIPWGYVASKSKVIRDGTADSSEVSKFNSSIWQLFNAYRPK